MYSGQLLSVSVLLVTRGRVVHLIAIWSLEVLIVRLVVFFVAGARECGRDALPVSQIVEQAHHGPSDDGEERESDRGLNFVNTDIFQSSLAPLVGQVAEGDEPHERHETFATRKREKKHM